MSLTLRIKMFGPFDVRREGEAEDSLQDLRTHRMAMRLLALLVLYANRALDKSEAATLLWGEGSGEDNLNQAITTLRKALGPEDGGRISAVARAVRLDLTGVEVDLLSFDRAWEERGQNLAPLQEAVEACAEPLLQGWDEPWLKLARARYTARYRQSLLLLANAALRGANHHAAQYYLGRLRLVGVCDTMLHIRLMEAWMTLKAYPSAMTFYEKYRDYLRRKHGIPPPEEMVRMYDSIPRVETEFIPPVVSEFIDIEVPGGAMLVSSRFYVERPADRDFHTALARRDGTILINGPRQVGKSSLMARGMEQGRQAGLRVVVTDFQKLDIESLQTINSFYRALLRVFHRKLSLATRPNDYWDPQLSPNENFEGYLQDTVLTDDALPLIWIIDEADRIFDRSYRGSFFGLLRSWHTARAEGPDSNWNRLTLILAYSTEVRLFIPDLDQSPFNVGMKLTLEDFTPEQVCELNARHDSPLREEEIPHLLALVGGHPYLVRLCLYEMKAHGLTVADLEAQADQDFGLFRDHLDRLYYAIVKDAELTAAVRGLLLGGAGLSPIAFTRLRSAGMTAGNSTVSARLRCGLYERYFTRHLGHE